MHNVNPKALIDARRKKGWTQQQLKEATKTHIDVSTISRIERGKSASVHKHTVQELARVLGVTVASLCEKPGVEPVVERDVVKLSLQPAARNALTLVALRYRVHREHIIELAPLLFFLVAEQCLQERRKRLERVREAADALWDIQNHIRHIPPNWPVDSAALTAEEESIKARDLFGTQVLDNAEKFLSDYPDDFDDAEQNPFVVHLRAAMTALGLPDDEIEAVRWKPRLGPNYRICAEQAGHLVGHDPQAMSAILFGSAALHEIPKASAEERAAWARAEHDRKYGDIDAIPDTLLAESPYQSPAANQDGEATP